MDGEDGYLRFDDVIATPLELSLPPALSREKSHNNINNNVGLHARVPAGEDIEPIRVTGVVIMLLSHHTEQTRQMD